MKLGKLFAFWMLILAFAQGLAQAQAAPICGDGPTCTPDSSAGSYGGAVAARAKILNARGFSSPIAARAPLLADVGNAGSTDTVIGSQSFNYAIPILALPGRAGMDLSLNLYYNSRIWDIDTTNNTVTFNADRDFPSYGFRLDFGYIEQVSISQMILTEGDGSKHMLVMPDGLGYLASTDGTSIAYGFTGANVLTYANGTQVQYQQFLTSPNLWHPVWIKNSNGNYIAISYVAGHPQFINTITDSLGRVITFNYDSSNHLTSLTQPVHPSGTKTYATFTWATPYSSGYSWYNFSGLAVNAAPSAAQINVLAGCTYPNGAGYRFTYGDWAIITKIEQLSSAGATRSYISYDYPLASQGALTDAPTYTHQTISPDGTSSNNSVWTYASTKSGTGVVTSMAITDPNGTISTTNLDPATGLASSAQVKDNSNTVLRTVNYTWITGAFAANLLSATTTTNDAGQQSSIQYAYNGDWDQLSDVYEYDFGSQLKRHTVTTYLSGYYATHHIVNLPTQIVVKDGAGNISARTDMAYDGSALTSVTGVASHDDSGYPASFTTRGNLTSVTRYANAAAGTGAFTRNLSYDSLGNQITAQLDCCNQKAFTFSSTTQYSAPDSVTRGPAGGPQFTTSYTYNPDNGLRLTTTDENNQTTQYQYDSMNRTTQVTLPPQNGTQVQVNTVYADDTVSPTVTSSSTANSVVTVVASDGLNHVMQVDNKNASTVISSVKYGYDKIWQRTQSSNPFAAGDTIVNTSFGYDALGRTTQVTPPSGGFKQYQYSGNATTITDPGGKQRKNYFDALGHLTQVNEPGETFAGTASSGTLTINGTLRGQTGSGTPASGSVTIGGQEGSTVVDPCQDQEPPRSCPNTIWDTGSVSITVNGLTKSVNYSIGSTSSSIASGLASAFNGDGNSPVTASASGSVVGLTAKTAGTVGNSYSLSATSSTSDPADFGVSFTTSTSGATLTGGIPGTTSYDSGTVNVTVGAFTASAPYSQGGNSTPAMVAAALVGTGTTGLNRSGSPLHATANGAGITLTYSTVGTAGNVAVSATSSTNDQIHFPGGSFSGSATLGGGLDSYSSGLAHPYATTYAYDALSNLTSVSQAAGNVNGQAVSGQPRSYAYDSLSRITSSTTPESGTVYSYYTDSGGNPCSGDPSLVCRVQDARGVVKTFTYDGINRITGVQYSDATPGVTYSYDIGGKDAFALNRLTKITEGLTNSQTLTYDNFGRTTSVAQVIDTTTYTTQYSYNLAGQLISTTYPTGRVVVKNVDGVGRLSSVASNGTNYLSGLSYNAAGETLGLTLGNGVQGSLGYNDHLQLSSLRYFKTGSSTDILNLGYDYGANNNGQIQAVHYYASANTNSEDPTKSEYFSYDPLGRLNAAHTGTVNSNTPGTWSLQWGYDRLGNRLSQKLLDGNVSVGQPQLVVDPATNRIANSGFTYDLAGNLTNDSLTAYSYDGANRLKQIGSGTAIYSYFGPLRIKKVVGSTTTVYIYSGNKPIVEYVNGSLSKEYVYADSELLATIAGNVATYHHADHLSNRVATDASGSVVRTYGHFPFGETWYETGMADKLKFTSYENDSGAGESGLNYAQYRYHSPGLGRFMAADLLAGSLSVPQSLNRYAYVLGDPVNLSDPLGLRAGGGWEPPSEKWCDPGLILVNRGGELSCEADPGSVPGDTHTPPGTGPGTEPGGGGSQNDQRFNYQKLQDCIAKANSKFVQGNQDKMPSPPPPLEAAGITVPSASTAVAAGIVEKAKDGVTTWTRVGLAAKVAVTATVYLIKGVWDSLWVSKDLNKQYDKDVADCHKQFGSQP